MNRQLSAVLMSIVGGLLLGASLRAAQEGPPVTGTIALEGTVNKVYAAANTITVKATDGVEHLFHFTKRTLVHGTREADDALDGLAEGSRVVVHYVADSAEKTAVEVDRIGADGLNSIEGVVTRVDHEAGTFSIRLADGTTETLELSERAASDVGKDIDRAAAAGERVIVYYTDEAGHRTAHYFKKIV
jgi:hypothetical protein